MISEKKIKLHECCVPVRGYKVGIIIDLQRKSFFIVPNTIIEILVDYECQPFLKLLSDFKESKVTLKKYIKFFQDNEIAFLTRNPENFVKISSEVVYPNSIDRIDIEADVLSDAKTSLLKNKIDSLGTSHLNLIFVDGMNEENAKKCLELLQFSKLISISIIVPFNSPVNIPALKAINARLTSIYFYDADVNGFEMKNDISLVNTKQNIVNLFTGGIQNHQHFIINQNAYLEAKQKNLYYNRRLHIDNNDNIKNSITQTSSFGKLDDIDAIIKLKEFNDLSGLTKDKIEVCKDCQFRYICPDNRIPVKINKQYQHTTACVYNPYEDKWSN